MRIAAPLLLCFYTVTLHMSLTPSCSAQPVLLRRADRSGTDLDRPSATGVLVKAAPFVAIASNAPKGSRRRAIVSASGAMTNFMQGGIAMNDGQMSKSLEHFGACVVLAGTATHQICQIGSEQEDRRQEDHREI